MFFTPTLNSASIFFHFFDLTIFLAGLSFYFFLLTIFLASSTFCFFLLTIFLASSTFCFFLLTIFLAGSTFCFFLLIIFLAKFYAGKSLISTIFASLTCESWRSFVKNALHSFTMLAASCNASASFIPRYFARISAERRATTSLIYNR